MSRQRHQAFLRWLHRHEAVVKAHGAVRYCVGNDVIGEATARLIWRAALRSANNQQRR